MRARRTRRLETGLLISSSVAFGPCGHKRKDADHGSSSRRWLSVAVRDNDANRLAGKHLPPAPKFSGRLTSDKNLFPCLLTKQFQSQSKPTGLLIESHSCNRRVQTIVCLHCIT